MRDRMWVLEKKTVLMLSLAQSSLEPSVRAHPVHRTLDWLHISIHWPILHARVEIIINGMFYRLSRPANSLDAKMPSADLFGSRCAFKKCVSIRVVQKTPTLEIESRSSGSPWFQTRWVQWCTKKSISSTIRGRELNFKFSKMHWRSKNQNAKIISSVCLKYAKWWEDSKSGLSVQIG